MLSTVNRPRVSRPIAAIYVGITVFIAASAVLFGYLGLSTPMGDSGVYAAVLLLIVLGVFVLLLASLYRTRYVLDEKKLLIKTSRLIGGSKTIVLDDVVFVDKTLIPFGVRLFGASFHGGYYQVPGLGRAFMAITNYSDGLLIKTRRGNYIITPRNPTEFKAHIEGCMKTKPKHKP